MKKPVVLAYLGLLLVAAAPGMAQEDKEAARGASHHEKAQEQFFSKTFWFWITVPFAATILIALSRKKPKRTIREYTPEAFDAEIIATGRPFLVHFYRQWSIGDQVMIAQVERIARGAQGFFEVGWVDVEKYPELLARYAKVEGPALLAFAGGKKIFHCEGVFDEADVRKDVIDALERWERQKKRGESGGAAVAGTPGAETP